jgi:hypothetical protein
MTEQNILGGSRNPRSPIPRESVSESESAHREEPSYEQIQLSNSGRHARKIRRQEKAAIIKPRPDLSPLESVTESRHVQSVDQASADEGDGRTWSRNLQNRGLNMRKRRDKGMPGMAEVTNFFHSQPNPPRRRLTVSGRYMDGITTNIGLSAHAWES